MPSITVRNIDDDLKKRLKDQATKHGCSMEEEVRRILRVAIHQQEMQEAKDAAAKQIATWEREKAGGKPSKGLGTEIHERFKALGGVELEPLPRVEIRWDNPDKV